MEGKAMSEICCHNEEYKITTVKEKLKPPKPKPRERVTFLGVVLAIIQILGLLNGIGYFFAEPWGNIFTYRGRFGLS